MSFSTLLGEDDKDELSGEGKGEVSVQTTLWK